MKENFPDLAKERDFRKSRKLRVSKKLDSRNHTPRHIIITSPKIKEERILEAAREKERVTYKGVPIRLSADFSKDLTGKKGLEGSIQSHDKQGPISKITLYSKAFI